MDRTSALTLELIKCALSGEKFDESRFGVVSTEDLWKIFSLSERHDVTALVAFSLKENGLCDGENAKALTEKFENRTLSAIYRYGNLSSVSDTLCAAFAKEKIPYILLKGAVMREYYPKPWMRTACDVDVLVKEADFSAACLALENAGLKKVANTPHDVSFVSGNGGRIELHHTLIEEEKNEKAAKVLSSVWEDAAQGQKPCEYRLSPEKLYFYHLAHTAKHFVSGGCGIRSILDLWLLEKALRFDPKSRNSVINAGGLDRFQDAVLSISDHWFSGKELPGEFLSAEKFVIGGGVYGSVRNSVLVGAEKENGKTRYLFRRVFLPYRELTGLYPSLEGKRALGPLYQCRRLFRIFKKKTFRKAKAELKALSSFSSEEINETRIMLSGLGLS